MNDGKIPEGAKKVFSGILFDTYQWEQELFDGSTATFEMLRRQDAAFIIPVLKNGNLLITEATQPGIAPKLTFPAGGIERGETPEEGIRREFLEETGYVPGELIPFTSIQPINKIDWTVHVFIGRNCEKVQEPQDDPGERVTCKEISFDELLLLPEEKEFQHSLLVPYLIKARYDEKERATLKEILYG